MFYVELYANSLKISQLIYLGKIQIPQMNSRKGKNLDTQKSGKKSVH